MSDDLLVISDLHCPFHHKDAFAFLRELHKKYKFNRIISIGDEVDYHALSFHDSDPDLDSAGIELQKSRECMWELWRMFPLMDILESNHGSLAYRKAKHHGVPRSLMLDYGDALFAEKDKKGNLHRPGMRGVGWKWHPELTIKLKDGRRVKFVHGRKSNLLMNVKEAGMCFVQGHFHSSFKIEYHHTSDFLNFGLGVGCLIDNDSLAFEYNKLQTSTPIIGCGGIINGTPRLFPMNLKKGGRWDGVVP